MGVVAARGDVGAGQPAEGELGAVGTTTRGHEHRLDAHLAICLEGIVDEALLGLTELLGHVAILLAEAHRDRALAVAVVEEGGDCPEGLLAGVKVRGVKVSQDVGERDVGGSALDVRGVIETLAALRVLGALEGGDELLELGRNRDGVDHHVLGAARVDHHAADRNRGLAGREALVVELAKGLAVHGVAPASAKGVEVEQLRAMTDLLVGNKGHLDRRVRQLGICHEPGEKRADLRNAGLVVGGEERGAVRADDVLTNKLREVGDLFGRGLHRLAVNNAGHERAALVVNHVRTHAGSGGVGRGVDVGAEQKRRALLAGTSRHRQRRAGCP